MSLSCLVADAPGAGTTDAAQLTHSQGCQRSHPGPAGQPPFLRAGTTQDSSPCLFPDLFCLYFFPQLKTEKFMSCQADPGVWGGQVSRPNGSHPLWSVKRPSLWLQVIIQKGTASRATSFVTRNTRDTPAGQGPFLFHTCPSRRTGEFDSCLAFQQRHPSVSVSPPQTCLSKLPAAPSPEGQKARAGRGTLSCPAKAPARQHLSPPFPRSLRNCILFACLIPTVPPPGPVR